MFGKIDKHDGVPAYIQIMSIVKKEIMLGRLENGDQLPPVREMAAMFGVNMNTVIRSLERLQFEGLVEAEHGVGYFVKTAHSINREVMKTISETVDEMKKNGIDLQMAKVLLEEVWKND